MLFPFFTLGLSLLLHPASLGARAQTVFHVVQDQGTTVVDPFESLNGNTPDSTLSFVLLGSADGATVYSELYIQVFTETPFDGISATTTETATFFNIISQSAGGYVEGSFNFPAIDGVGETVSCVYGSEGQDAVCEQVFVNLDAEDDESTTSTFTYTGRAVPLATLFAQETRTTLASQSSTASSTGATPAQTSAGASPTSVAAQDGSEPAHKTSNIGAVVGRHHRGRPRPRRSHLLGMETSSAKSPTPPILCSATSRAVQARSARGSDANADAQAQTLYALAFANPASDAVVSKTTLYSPIATGADGQTTWIAEEVVSYEKFFSEAEVAITAPTTFFHYTFVPNADGLVVAGPSVTLGSITKNPGAVESCAFDPDGIGLCVQQNFASATSGTGLETLRVSYTATGIPIFTISIGQTPEDYGDNEDYVCKAAKRRD
ncbi:hypothetical protein HMN09_00917800 [Mycena chlorophos]|uniref:Uncharacterized protein n=1 Tax=Mycena chlorophos TaxID=658473 RepID=A0A8H6SK85_MYCCL|nr:hypothetical protein HMN09_00917800 [Mycena chlorophos]